MMQDEIIHWLIQERGVAVHKSTISRLLKREGWSRKRIYRILSNRSESLRATYKAYMSRYSANVRRGRTWSICAEYTRSTPLNNVVRPLQPHLFFQLLNEVFLNLREIKFLPPFYPQRCTGAILPINVEVRRKINVVMERGFGGIFVCSRVNF